ncbi:hypothetical protein DL96DRAFT_1731713 [Flagelloscypha sp. PMI_526]|nr:hypothetical protein DL96DRAFT_1731713 [Flagelloscypha sp. PMI_526]
MSSPLEFALVTAFADTFSGGNPALIVFDALHLPEETFREIARLYQQPMTSFVGPVSISEDEKIAQVSIRWFTTPGPEAALCGHGTLAAAVALIQTGKVGPKVEEILFFNDGVMKLAVRPREGGIMELELPASPLVPLSAEKEQKARDAANKAFGRNLDIKFVGTGVSGGFPLFVVFELGESETLAGEPFAPTPLLQSGFPMHVFARLTGKSASDGLFVSRMLSPATIPGDGEDHVCGSAHSMLVPYFAAKCSPGEGRGYSCAPS